MRWAEWVGGEANPAHLNKGGIMNYTYSLGYKPKKRLRLFWVVLAVLVVVGTCLLVWCLRQPHMVIEGLQ